jgi:hypothetical protein
LVVDRFIVNNKNAGHERLLFYKPLMDIYSSSR